MNWFWRQIYRQYRLFTWLQYAAGRRLTATGGLLLAGLVMTLVMSVNHESMVAYQAITLLLFVWVSAPVAALWFRVNLSVTRTLPRFGTVGQATRYPVRVRNRAAKPQPDFLLLEDLKDPRPSFPEWLALKKVEQQSVRPFWLSGRPRGVPTSVAQMTGVPVPALPPGREVEVTVELTPLRRGVLELEGLTAARPDPLGLFRALRKIVHPGKMLILPKRYPLPPLAMPGTLKYQEGGVALAAQVGQSDEFVALRDYRHGDPLRHIHWRSWARTGKPIVKEFEDEFFVRHALVLDTFAHGIPGEVFEEAVSVAASFACTIPTQESLLDLLFVGTEAYCFTAGRSLAHGDQMLEILAAVQPCPQTTPEQVRELVPFMTQLLAGRPTVKTFADLEQLVVNHASQVSNCICILLAWDAPRQRLVEKLIMSGVPVLVLVVLASRPKVPLDAGPLRNDPANFHTLVLGAIETGLQLI